MKILLSTLLLFCITNLSTFAEWKVLSNYDGIKVYEKVNHDSEIIPLKAEATISYSIEKVVDVLGNTEKKMEWMPKQREARTLSKKNYWDRIEYSRSIIPWPFSDRDFVYHAKVDVLDNGQKYIATMKSVEGEFPEVKGVVRANMIDGTIELKKIDDNNTFMIMNFNADPKGSLPRWLANWAQKGWPREMIEAMNEQLRRLYPQIDSAKK